MGQGAGGYRTDEKWAKFLYFRGYYYDQETGLYYLQSRYYDPEIGRFINADDVAYLGVSSTPLGYNLFTYCENNPIDRIDLDGSYFLSKYAIYFIGKKFLQLKGYSLSASLWSYAFYRGTYTYGKLCESILKSITFRSEVKKYLVNFNQKGKNKSFKMPTSTKIVVKFTSGDLLYSVGKMYLYISGSYSKMSNYRADTKYNNISSYYNMSFSNAKRYMKSKPIGYVYLWVKFGDTYNFEGWNWNPSFKNYANNLGILMQALGYIKPFSWSHGCSIVYYVY